MEDARRKRARVEVGPAANNVASPFDSLPDEMLVAIFQHVDSVTRQNAASVCRRWESLLRESCLRTMIKVDMSILPPPSQLTHRIQLHKRCALFVTVCRLMQKHPDHETLHIYDSAPLNSALASQGVSDDALNDKKAAVRCALEQLGGRTHVVDTLILDRLPIDLCEMVEFLEYVSCFSAGISVVLRDVQISGLAVGNLVRGGRQFEELDEDRRVVNVSCRLVAGPSARSTLAAALAEQDAPLEAIEEEQYLQVMSSLQQIEHRVAIAEIAISMQRFTNHRPTHEGILTGSALNALCKRLVIAGRHRLVKLV